MSPHPLSPPVFPATWASEWGEDQYGLWMAFSYQGNRHVFRWIPPGSFMMGPKGRSDDRETQRKVTFEEGFWLGDFPVTQGLYQAIMGENPSHFKNKSESESLPVEKVSWHDAQKFITALNELHPELNTYLPLETQWEYACRAGTTTPFWFGDQIDLEKVNYDGNWEWGEKTDGDNPEGALEQANQQGNYPANPWGLFDMHGNIFEWCLELWQDKHNEMPVIISLAEVLPKQIEQSLQLAQDDKQQAFPLRGGSWYDFGQFCRSANRRGFRAVNRSHYVGFRLSIGPEQP